MKYGTLAHKHEEYTPAIWAELDDFYEGGYAVQRHAARYIKQHPGETQERYEARLDCAAYINHTGPIIDILVSGVFGQTLTMTQGADSADASTPGKEPVDPDYYTAFAHDADLKGTSILDILKCALTTALLKRRAIIGVDLPASSGVQLAATRADEDKLGMARAYCFEVPIEQLIDWECDDQGNYKWAVLHRVRQDRETPETRGEKVYEEFKIWRKTMVGQDGATLAQALITWEIYKTPLRKPDEVFKPEDEIPKTSEGATTFAWIPLVELCLKKGLWAGNKLGGMAREHYSRRSSLVFGEADALHAIPYVKLGAEVPAVGGALPSEIQSNPHRGDNIPRKLAAKGFLQLGAGDDVGFAEPTGHSFEIVDGQLDKLVDDMYRVTHEMASSVTSTSTSLGRSGTSKQEDRHATEVVLGELGSQIRAFGKKVYETVSSARKDRTLWTPHGLDDYDLEDRETILEEATSMEMVTIPSRTFKRLYATRVAFALLGEATPEIKKTIQDEIEAGIDEAIEAEKLAKESAEQNDPNAPPKPKAPAVAKPAAPAVPKPKAPAKPAANG